MFIRFTQKLVQILAFELLKFQLNRNTRFQVKAIFAKCAKKEEKNTEKTKKF